MQFYYPPLMNCPKHLPAHPLLSSCPLLNHCYYYFSLILICTDCKYTIVVPFTGLQATSRESDVAYINHECPATPQLGVGPQEPFLHLCWKFNWLNLVRCSVSNQSC